MKGAYVDSIQMRGRLVLEQVRHPGMDQIQLFFGDDAARYRRLIRHHRHEQTGIIESPHRLGSAWKQTHLLRMGQIGVVNASVFNDHSVPVKEYSNVWGLRLDRSHPPTWLFQPSIKILQKAID
jgi:hypothetical protein